MATRAAKRPARRTCCCWPTAPTKPLACARPQTGNLYGLFDIETSFDELCGLMEEARILLKRLFLNTSSGFDAKVLRGDCFWRGIEANSALNPRSRKSEDAEDTYLDTEHYRERTIIERTNSWLDSSKILLVRFETNTENWLAFHLWLLWCFYCAKSRLTRNPKQPQR